MKILIINGPNLNMLGIREPDIYGRETYSDLVELIGKWADELKVEVECFQSNWEGAIVDKIQAAYGEFQGIVINPAAYTHTSVAILDALKTVAIKAVEVHISNVSEREAFRQISYVRSGCIGTVMGEGFLGYKKAMKMIVDDYDIESEKAEE